MPGQQEIGKPLTNGMSQQRRSSHTRIDNWTPVWLTSYRSSHKPTSSDELRTSADRRRAQDHANHRFDWKESADNRLQPRPGTSLCVSSPQDRLRVDYSR